MCQTSWERQSRTAYTESHSSRLKQSVRRSAAVWPQAGSGPETRHTASYLPASKVALKEQRTMTERLNFKNINLVSPNTHRVNSWLSMFSIHRLFCVTEIQITLRTSKNLQYLTEMQFASKECFLFILTAAAFPLQIWANICLNSTNTGKKKKL